MLCRRSAWAASSVIASMQASEVIKIITGINSGKGSFFQIDLRDMYVSRFDID